MIDQSGQLLDRILSSNELCVVTYYSLKMTVQVVESLSLTWITLLFRSALTWAFVLNSCFLYYCLLLSVSHDRNGEWIYRFSTCLLVFFGWELWVAFHVFYSCQLVITNGSLAIGHFRYGISLLQLPESFWFLFSHTNYSYCSFLSTGITKFEFIKKNEMNSDSCSKKTPSWKWPIVMQVFLSTADSYKRLL